VEDVQVQQADGDVAQLGQRADDLTGDQVEAAPARLEDDPALRPDRRYRSPGIIAG
jgi:hypothetical protein